MSDLVRLIAEFIQLLWPFRLVRTGERGGYYIGGRFWRDVGPGCWPVIPWFMDVKAYPEVPAIISTPRLDITLKDGTLLSFSVAASVRMADYHLAINTVDSYTETMIELLSAVCADRLAAVETDRLDPERRGRLLPDLRRWVNEESRTFGVETQRVRFTSFILNPRVWRLLQDATAPGAW